MKVYVVEWFSAEQYSDYSGIHKVFASREDAERYVVETGKGPHGVNEEECDEGYFLHTFVEEYEVE